MRRLTDTDGLTEFQRDILRTVREFVDAEVLPVASELDHADAYPAWSRCGYSTEHEIERLYRDAPMLLIGEGTAEIQKMIIGRRLVRDYPAGA